LDQLNEFNEIKTNIFKTINEINDLKSIFPTLEVLEKIVELNNSNAQKLI